MVPPYSRTPGRSKHQPRQRCDITPPSPDEFASTSDRRGGSPFREGADLGHTLDDLFARLQASFDTQRHFVANASHELRTPLAGLRTLLEVALADPDADTDTLRSACQEALALGGYQERLVQALLTLATGKRGVTRWDTLDLAHVVEGVLASRRDQATERRIDLTEHLTPAVTAGDPRLIESLVANLIDNAIRHNHRQCRHASSPRHPYHQRTPRRRLVHHRAVRARISSEPSLTSGVGVQEVQNPVRALRQHLPYR
ncbi:histidine kinase dimerization/phospho-acceptor domain-containing protein [Streptosporangium sp. CA-115845]|uniref:histidine kinase dimerization/phospho-acceptor domain-containing protein n=1 Tax=Streptosporangium sp. CA-115845 TaxID=3240071 RepID=UPI003D9127A6